MYNCDTLFNMFEANLNQHSSLTRDKVLNIARTTFASYLPSVSVSQVGMTSEAPPIHWSKILLSKLYGLKTYFNVEYDRILTETPGLNHFAAVSQLRNLVEGTPKWNDYVSFVHRIHPNGSSLGMPPPRKAKSVPVMVTVASDQTPQSGIPINGPQIITKPVVLIDEPIVVDPIDEPKVVWEEIDESQSLPRQPTRSLPQQPSKSSEPPSGPRVPRHIDQKPKTVNLPHTRLPNRPCMPFTN